jgi:2-deoxy-D-gluconate 3-dehydrogenase
MGILQQLQDTAGRCGEPDDIKGAVVYLASGASHYVEGEILTVDGG